MGWFSKMFETPDFSVYDKVDRIQEIRDRQDEIASSLTREEVKSDKPTRYDKEYKALQQEWETLMDEVKGKVVTVDVDEPKKRGWFW